MTVERPVNMTQTTETPNKKGSQLRFWIFVAAINGLIAVAMGALGTHYFSQSLDEGQMIFIHLAANYQLWHALGLLGVGLLGAHVKAGTGERLVRASGVAFTIGIVGFSGGLYLLALMGPGIVHWVIPLGGSLLITGWLGLSAAAFFIDSGSYRPQRLRKQKRPEPRDNQDMDR